MFEYSPSIYNTNSAKEVIPFLNEIFHPESVLDVGCGLGTWLKVFSEYKNVCQIFGVDGSYTNKDLLVINEKYFLPHDLTQPLVLKKKFDLILCLEVAEHLPENSSDVLVKSLVDHSDAIVFSAAIPEQSGDGHINEQWPDYWRKKFMKHEFYCYDILRKKFWENEMIEWWYRQNMVIYIKAGSEKAKFAQPEEYLLSFIHPSLFNKRIKDGREIEDRLRNIITSPGVKKSFKDLVKALKSKIHP